MNRFLKKSFSFSYYLSLPNVSAQGQARFAATNCDLPEPLAAKLDFEKPRCSLVPCSALLCIYIIVIMALVTVEFHLPAIFVCHGVLLE